MLRLEGDVFLLGTAIAAPALKKRKLRRFRAYLNGNSRGGGRIVANRGSYSG
jgi:hypothetical protein